MNKAAGVLVAAATALPATGAAEDFGLRVKPAGLEALERAAQAMVPEQIVLEDLETEVLGCELVLSDGVVDANLREVELSALDGALRAAVLIDLEAAAEIDLCEGSMTCDVHAAATPFAASLEIPLARSADDWLAVGDVEADLALTPGEFDIQIDGCAAGDFYPSIRQLVIQLLRPLAERLVSGRIADRIGDVLADTLPRRFEAGELMIEVALSELGLDPDRGIDVAGTATVSSLGSSSGAPALSAPEGEPLPQDFGPGDVAVAASDRLVSEALYEAWQVGLLELALADVAPSIPLSEDGFAQQLGLPAGSAIDLGIRVGAAPKAAFSREREGVSVWLEDLVIELAVDSPGQSRDAIEIAADAHMRAGVIVSGAGALSLDPQELEITHLVVTGGSREIAADPARLAVFLQDVGVPLLAERLADLPIAPALRPVDGLYVWMRQLETERGWLRVGLDLVVPDPDDIEPPSTRFEEPPNIVAAGLTRLPVTGEDDTTPAPLLRYEATIDGTPITSEPEFLSAIPIAAADGEYTLEVTAVDLAGNADPTPLRYLLVVDGVPPALEVLDAPSHTAGNSARASWRATDDRGIVTTRWELLEVDAGGAAREVKREGEAGAEGEVSLQGLRRGAHYVLRITAIDEAGNVTSEDFGFGSVQGGCAAAAGAGPGSLVIVLGAMLVLVSRRRIRLTPAAAAMLTVLSASALPTSAFAQGIGTHFSGPTDADGAAAFWNPAAMTRGEGTQAYAASGLSLIRIDYDADAAGRSSTFVPKPEPTVGAFTGAAGEDWRFGFTFGAPQIDGATWRRDDGAGGITRYYATSAQYFHLTATPAVAYRASPWLSVGGGVRLVRSQMVAELDRDIGSTLNTTLGSSDPDAPFPYAEPVLAAPTELRAAGWGVGLVAGALVTPPAPITIGIGLHSPSTSKATGEVRADYPQELRDFVAEAEPDVELPELAGNVNADLKMPLMAFTSVAYTPVPRWELLVDYRFIQRSKVANTDVIVTESTSPTVSDTAVVRGYRDRHSIGLRASHRIAAAPVGAALRVRFESNSVPEETSSPSNVDFNKLELGGAATWSATRRVDLIAQYSRFILGTRHIDENLHRPLAEPSLAAFNKPSPTGNYRGASNYLAAGVSTRW